LLHINGGDNSHYSHSDNRITIAGHENVVNVSFSGKIAGRKKVEVYDISGRLLNTSYAEIGQNYLEIPMQIRSQGSYLIHVSSKDATKSQKIFMWPQQ
jgi:hypothetical protein